MIRRIKAIFGFAESIVVGIGAFFAAQWKQYNAVGQLCFVIAVVALAVDAGISYKYGAAQTFLHGIGFALVAIAFCILPDVAMEEKRKGNASTAGWIATACIPLGLVAYQSHVGYSAGVRLNDMQQTGFHNASLEARQAGVKSEETNIASYRAKLAKLERERDEKKTANPWAASTNAIALKAEINNLEGDFVYKRSRQCADVTLPDSRKHCDKITAAKSRLGEIEDLNRIATEITTTEGLIAATQKKIDDKVQGVSDTGFQSSTVVNQNGIFASLVNLVRGMDADAALKPTDVHLQLVNTGLAGVNSIGFMILAAVMWLAAGCNRIRSAVSHPFHSDEVETHGVDITPAAGSTNAIGHSRVIHTKEVRTDRHVWNDLRRALAA